MERSLDREGTAAPFKSTQVCDKDACLVRKCFLQYFRSAIFCPCSKAQVSRCTTDDWVIPCISLVCSAEGLPSGQASFDFDFDLIVVTMLGNQNRRQSTSQKKMQPGSKLKLCIGAYKHPDVTVFGTGTAISLYFVFQRFGAPPVAIPNIWCGVLSLRFACRKGCPL